VPNPDELPSVFVAAIRGALGWWLVVFLTMFTGVWLGAILGHRAFVAPDAALGVLALCTFAWLFYPQVALAILVSLAAFCLPMRSESRRLHVMAACASFAAWFAVAAWVLP